MSTFNDINYIWCNMCSYFDASKITMSGRTLRWVKKLANTKVEMFGYKNLPNDLTPQILESALLFMNCLCFYNSKEFGLCLCKYRYSSDFDLYWKPKRVEVLTISGYSIATNVPFEDIILVRDNKMDIIPFITIMSYVEDICSIENTLFSNMEVLKLPWLFTGDKNQVATYKQLIKKATNYEPFALSSKANNSLSLSSELKDFNFPVTPQTYKELIEWYKNEAMRSIGIYSADEKRERIVNDEIQASNEVVDFIYEGMKNERLEFIKLVNEKFGTNIELIESYKQFKESDIELEVEQAKEIAKVENIEQENSGEDN